MFARLLLPVIIFLLFVEARAAVELGIDRLQTMNFAPLVGRRVGLITNQSGVDSGGAKTRLILRRAPNVNLVALFSPEHGLDGAAVAGAYVPSRRDSATGLPVHSLYGPTRKPTPEMLRGVDLLVYDLQDIGCRSYTYISTMARAMEAAGEAGVDFLVLDRPNPLGGIRVEGPPIEPQWISFVGQLPVPYVHGMTAGELARMSNTKGWMGARCRLSIIEMRGWNRRMTWRDTGLRWVAPSPNIPRADSPFYYVATGLPGELGGLETGVGGPTPFEIFASRSLNASRLAAYCRSLQMPGVTFRPYVQGPWQGVRLEIEPHSEANLTALGLHLLAEANRLTSPDVFTRTPVSKLDLFFKCYGSRSIREQLTRGTPLPGILDGWRRSNTAFEAQRTSYLLY